MADSGRISKSLIDKLTGENYDSWSFRMLWALRDRGLWRIVSGNEELPAEAEESEKQELKKKNDKALPLIGLHVADALLPHVIYAQKASEAWSALKDLRAEESQAQRAYLRRQLHHLKSQEGESIAELVNRMKKIAHKLGAAGCAPEEDTQARSLLNALPSERKAAAAALEPSNDLSLNLAYAKLLLEEPKLKSEEISQDPGASQGEAALGAKENRKRFYCKKKGRIKRHCRKHKKGKKNGEINHNDNADNNTDICQLAFMATQSPAGSKKRFLIDSGASSHMACHKNWLQSLKNAARIESAALGDGRKVKVRGAGEVIIRVNAESAMSLIRLKGALYAPKLSANLLPLSKITENNYQVSFQDHSCAIANSDGMPAARAVKINNLCNLIGKIADDPATANESAFLANDNSDSLWRYRHGHLNSRDLQKLSSGMVDGIKLSKSEDVTLCEPCALGKGRRAPFKKERSSDTSEASQLAHSDLCGPVTPPSAGGGAHALALIDDYSRISWARILKKKSGAAGYAQDWVKYAEKQSSGKVKRLRADRGGECVKKALRSYFKSAGIHHEETTACSPSQNGAAERLNRALFDKARSMLARLASPSKKLWAEAAAAANCLRNRSPAKVIKNCAPCEKLTKKKPGAGHLRIFGCKACAHMRKAKRKGKLSHRSEVGVMAGHAHDSKGHRAFDSKTSIIRISRDVALDEASILINFKDIIEDASESLELENDPELDQASDDDQHDRSNDHAAGADISAEMQEDEALGEEQAQGSGKRHPARDRRQAMLCAPGEGGAEAGSHIAAIAFAEPSALRQALDGPDRELWEYAINDEMKSLLENEAWESCDLPEGREAIAAKWALKLKKNEAGEVARHKARLVAKGFTQRPGIDYAEAFSPVTRFATLRAMLGIAAMKSLIIKQAGIKAAFLSVLLRRPATK